MCQKRKSSGQKRKPRIKSGVKKSKISLFCDVGIDAVVTAKDVECIYEVPLVFHKEGLDSKIVELLKIWTRAPRLEAWSELVQKIQKATESVTIAIVGKYVDLTESYKSLNEALYHGGAANDSKVNLVFVDSEKIIMTNKRLIIKYFIHYLTYSF